MKRGLKKTFFMVKGSKHRSVKKRAIKHHVPIANGMITNPIVSAADLSQNNVQLGSAQNNEEDNEP